MDLLNLTFITGVIALLAGAAGFSGIAGGASGFAKGICALFAVATLLILVMVAAGVKIPL